MRRAPALFLPVVLGTALAACPVAAATPYRVKDINQQPAGAAGSNPRIFAEVGGVAVFVADDPANGGELWASDGTAAGTRLLKDICAGPCTGPVLSLGKAGGRLFFIANTSAGRGLWATDGTPAGTVQTGTVLQVGTTKPGVIESLGLLLFPGSDVDHGTELWASDGTPGGTRRVADIQEGSFSSSPNGFFDLGGRALFEASDLAHGSELWATDGTAAGTVLVADIVPGADSSNPAGLAVVQGRLLFLATDPVAGRELWASDGTPHGTYRVKDILPGVHSSQIFPMGSDGARLYFAADDGVHGRQLWLTDGTAAGTRRLTYLGADFLADNTTPSLAFVGNSAYFFANGGVHGSELWKTDGTAAGTRLVADACPGSCSTAAAFLTNVDGTLYFDVHPAATKVEIWASNGTAAGTRRLAQVCDCFTLPTVLTEHALHGVVLIDGGQGGVWRTDGTAAGTYPLQPALRTVGNPVPSSYSLVLGETLLFGADDGVHGSELWASDGTLADTRLVKDIAGVPGASPGGLRALGSQLLFFADDGVEGQQLWASDGTALGTNRVIPIEHSTDHRSFTPLASVAGKLFFAVAVGPAEDDLWITDGTAPGTVRLTHTPEDPSAGFRGTAVFGGQLFFFLGGRGGLWKSDGTVAGTVPVAPDLFSPAFGLYNASFATLGGRLFFSAESSAHPGMRLWQSDGTPQGTVPVPVSLGDSPAQLTVVQDTLFFVAPSAGFTSLWKSDGTAAGTTVVKGAVGPSSMTAVGSQLFFLSGGNELQLWVSDGTEAGTHLVPGAGALRVTSDLAAVGNRVYFAADDGVHGQELWASDGTRPGTFLVRDVQPGPAGSSPQSLTAVGSLLYFAADDGTTGLEPWRSDGTPAGTVRLGDVAPGPGSSVPGEFTVAGDRLFFVADDGVTGAELWALCPNDPPRATAADLRVQAAPGGAQAIFAVTLSNPFCAPVTITYSTSDGSARAGRDYGAVAGTLTFPPGTTSLPVTVPILATTPPLHDASFFLRLTGGDEAAPGSITARATIAGSTPGGGDDGSLSADEVACDAGRLAGLLDRLSPAPTSGAAKPIAINLSLTASGDFAGLAYTANGPGSPERQLAFSTNPEETTLLRNPARPQLASVSATVNPLASDLLSDGDPGALTLRLNPTLDLTHPDPSALLLVDNRSGSAGHPADARPGRGVAPLLAACHGALPARDGHLLRLLTRLARVEVAGASELRLASYRGGVPDVYRIDVYPRTAAGVPLGRLSAELAASFAADGAWTGGTLRLLGPCATAGAADCTDLTAAATLRLVRPVPAGASWPETPYRIATGGATQVAVDGAALLAGTDWSHPLDSGATAPDGDPSCDGARLDAVLARTGLTAQGVGTAGINLSVTGSGDFAGLVYGRIGVSERLLAFSTNPEETTLLRNPGRPQLASLSLTRNALASDLVTSAVDTFQLTLNPTLNLHPAPADLLAIDNRSGAAGGTSARPGRGLSGLLGACRSPLSLSDVHVLRLLTRLVRVSAAGSSRAQVALYRGSSADTYRVDAYPLGAGGERLGRLSAEITVTHAADGALAGGTLRLLPSSVTGTAELLLIRPSGVESVYRIALGGTTERAVDWSELLAGTGWSRPPL